MKGFIGIVLIFIIGMVLIHLPHIERREYTVTVTSLEIKRFSSEGKDIYLVFTKLDNGEVRVFKNTDSLIEFKFNSSDFQAKLEPNKKYKLKVYGWRIPFLSQYENIIKVQPLWEFSVKMFLTHLILILN